jgi:hypothetical protein
MCNNYHVSQYEFSTSVGEAFSISFGICVKRNSKDKRKLEDGRECVKGEYFKYLESMTKGCSMGKYAKDRKLLGFVDTWSTFVMGFCETACPLL